MRAFLIIPFCVLGLVAETLAGRSAQVLLFKPPAGAPASVFLHSGVKEPFKIDLPQVNFSDSFELPKGELNLRFLETALPADAEMPAGAPTVRIPEAWDNVLLLAFTDPANKILPLQFKAINASGSVFGVGDTLIVNFTEATVTGTFGNRNLTVRPKEQLIAGDVSGGNTSFKVQLDSVTKETGRAPLIRQVWRHYPASRQLVYIYTFNDGPVAYLSFPIHNL